MKNEFYSLSQYINTHVMDIETFLELAIAICKSLQEFHRHNAICHYLDVYKIQVNPAHQIRISMSEKNENASHVIYSAPEQILKDAQQVDHHTDIYVLGIIFYEMLLDELPFGYTNLLEYSHTIVTKKVPLVSDKDKEIPQAISLIIEKMTAINPAERYQEILSVSIDLTKVLQAFRKNEVLLDFKPDTLNSLLELYTNERVYGREKEEQKIQYLIDSKVNKENKVILINGHSGVGKTSLVNKIVKKNKNTFSQMLRFKLDYGEQSRPYQVLYMALRHLAKQIIVQDEETLNEYKNKLTDILGTQAQTLIDVIPEIETIIGKQPASKMDSNVNLDHLVVRFMELFVDKDKPLCIYVDDIQWADRGTIDWIKNVLSKLDNIVLLLTNRDDEMEISKDHFLNSMLFEMESYGIKVDEVEVLALAQNDIEKLIIENMQLSQAPAVAELMYVRTKGNPFFVKQYLKQLYKDDAIWFDMQTLGWHCDLAKMNRLQISDNVFDMLSENIDALDVNVRKLLCIASCMGNTFLEDILEKVFDDDPHFEASLSLALFSGWIVEDGLHGEVKRYRFLHDKMQQTMHTFLSDKMEVKLHYKIGCHLKRQSELLDKQKLLTCVNHLNIGSLYVRDKQFLGQLNIQAAHYAKKSGDFESALKYIKKSMELCFLNCSLENTAMMLKLRAECEHLCNHSDEAIVYYEKALELAANRLQKAEIYELLIKLYADISQFHKAYEVGSVAVKSFGIKIPKKFVPPLFIVEFLKLKLKLRAYQTEDLINLPQNDDENFKMTIRLMANILQAAYQIRPELCVANAMIIVKLCLEYGLTKEAVIGFTVFGVIFQGAIVGNHDTGFAYSKLSFDMLERFDNKIQHAEVKFVSGYFGTSWKQPAIETEENWMQAYKNGLEIGDWFHTGCAAAGIVQSMFMRGVAFTEIFSQIKYFEKIVASIGTREQHGAIISVKQAVLNLSGQTQGVDTFDDINFNESAYVKSLEEYESKHFAHYYFINKMITLYIHKEYDKARLVSQKAKKFSQSSKGMLHDTEYMFYYALILAQLFSQIQVDLPTKIQYKKNLKRMTKKFIRWAEDCPENFLVRSYIMQGEMYRIKGEYNEAFHLYEKAIKLAKIYTQTHLEAIANRLMAEHYEVMEQDKAASLYHTESLQAFSKWGMMNSAQIQYNEKVLFDVNTLIKSSEVIAKEHEFSSLLQTLIYIIMENAGAQHGFLLLEKEGDLRIQASAYEGSEKIEVMQDISYKEYPEIVHPIVNYVLRSKEAVLIDDMTKSNIFDISYSSSRIVKSVLCAPLILQGEIKGVIYLENNQLPGVFTEEKVKLLQYLSGQIVISIENTIVYDSLEEKIKQRTKDLETTKDELRLLASMDPMTKLYNRRYFSEVSANIFDLSKREEFSIIVAMFDIDNFKNVNDTYGHPVGDKVIIAIADIVRNHTRKSDIACRFGGEEFIILLPYTAIKDALQLVENIRRSVENIVIALESDQVLHVTISAGVSFTDMTVDKDIEVAIYKADNALYEAKRSGKNKVLSYKSA
ncbi:MAG: diguanylate cyclase [Sulfurovum sp.]|nr:diguanylate cyclase [Sulfurovum sp.]